MIVAKFEVKFGKYRNGNRMAFVRKVGEGTGAWVPISVKTADRIVRSGRAKEVQS